MMLSNRLMKHFGAAAAAATVVGGASAAVVQSSVANVLIPVNTAGIYVNIVAGTTGTGSSLAGWDINPWNASNLSFFNPNAPTGGVYVRTSTTVAGVSNLAVGTVVGASSLYASGAAQSTGSNPFILNSSNNFVGFRFVNEANGNAIHYGYMQIELGASPIDPVRKIVGIWYEDVAGAAITVPAPGAFALLGLAGLAGRRRR